MYMIEKSNLRVRFIQKGLTWLCPHLFPTLEEIML